MISISHSVHPELCLACSCNGISNKGICCLLLEGSQALLPGPRNPHSLYPRHRCYTEVRITGRGSLSQGLVSRKDKDPPWI